MDKIKELLSNKIVIASAVAIIAVVTITIILLNSGKSNNSNDEKSTKGTQVSEETTTTDETTAAETTTEEEIITEVVTDENGGFVTDENGEVVTIIAGEEYTTVEVASETTTEETTVATPPTTTPAQTTTQTPATTTPEPTTTGLPTAGMTNAEKLQYYIDDNGGTVSSRASCYYDLSPAEQEEYKSLCVEVSIADFPGAIYSENLSGSDSNITLGSMGTRKLYDDEGHYTIAEGFYYWDHMHIINNEFVCGHDIGNGYVRRETTYVENSPEFQAFAMEKLGIEMTDTMSLLRDTHVSDVTLHGIGGHIRFAYKRK